MGYPVCNIAHGCKTELGDRRWAAAGLGVHKFPFIEVSPLVQVSGPRFPYAKNLGVTSPNVHDRTLKPGCARLLLLEKQSQQHFATQNAGIQSSRRGLAKTFVCASNQLARQTWDLYRSPLGRTESPVLSLTAQETFDQGSEQWRLLLHRVMATLTK